MYLFIDLGGQQTEYQSKNNAPKRDEKGREKRKKHI